MTKTADELKFTKKDEEFFNMFLETRSLDKLQDMLNEWSATKQREYFVYKALLKTRSLDKLQDMVNKLPDIKQREYLIKKWYVNAIEYIEDTSRNRTYSNYDEVADIFAKVMYLDLMGESYSHLNMIFGKYDDEIVFKILVCLKRYGYDVTKHDKGGKTFLMYPWGNRHINMRYIKGMMDCLGMDINAQSVAPLEQDTHETDGVNTAKYGYFPAVGATPLMYAMLNKATDEIISTLIALGADVNMRDSMGRTALMYAMYRWEMGSRDNFSTLIKWGADLNIRDNDGYTALMLACMRDDSIESFMEKTRDLMIYESISDYIMILLDDGADITLTDPNGKTAYDHIKENKTLHSSKAYYILKKLTEDPDLHLSEVYWG